MTSYRVFEKHGDGWDDCGVYDAHSAKDAVRKHVATLGPNPTPEQYAATPDASWKTYGAKVETVKKVTVA